MCGVGQALDRLGNERLEWPSPSALDWDGHAGQGQGGGGWRECSPVCVPCSSHAKELSRGRVGALAVHDPDSHSRLSSLLTGGYLYLGTLSADFMSKNLGALSKSVMKECLHSKGLFHGSQGSYSCS